MMKQWVSFSYWKKQASRGVMTTRLIAEDKK
jgi:hypothetical protein